MKVIFILLLIGLSIFLIVILVKHILTKNRLMREFRSGNVIVSGPKGYAKDVLFQTIINKRKEPYFANIDYGGDGHPIEMKDLLLDDNDYHNFINGNINICKKNDELENRDIYFSDGGIIIPSQADSYLHKIYPSLPITYALSRHLYYNNIHINTQRIERVWKALREQADYFVLMRKRPIKLPFFMVIFTTEYTRYESAKAQLAPMKSSLFNKYSKAEINKYKALHGDIVNGLMVVNKRSLHYDTRAYHEKLFGIKAPRKEKTWKRLKNYFKRITKSLWNTLTRSKKRK